MHHPAAVVWHRVPEIRSRFSYFKSRCFSEGVSKAQVTDYVGGADGLSSERRYVLKTLSTGVRRNIKLALSNRELGGLMRAGTIFIGLFLTTLGYLYGKAIPRAHMKKALSPASKKPSPMPVVQAADRSPITIQQIELSEPIPSIPSAEGGRAGTDRNFKGLIRLHSQPLGLIDLVMPSGGLTSRALASQIWNSLADKIQDHLKDDGIPTPDTLDEQGIPDPEGAGCKQRISAKSDEEPYISIVIATRDHLDSLVPCLESILALAYENYDLIVVDNAPSSNATRDFIENTYRNHPKIRYLHEDIPGLAIAHNRGLAATQAPIVAFTDDDVLVDPHWLQAIARNFLSDPKIGCVSGMIVPIELEAPSQFWIEQFGGFGKGFDRKIYDLETYRPADILFPYAAGKFGSGANMAFRMSALRAVGGFDPALGAGTLASGGDDLAAFFETITHGYRLVYEPGALVFHRHHRDYASLRKQVYGYGVGLGAFLMKTVVDKPIRFLELMAKTPSGLKYYFSSRSLKNQKKQKSFPRELSILELRGLLYGPFAYLRSRRKTAKTQGRLSFPDPGY
jgi:GT2 family glycosyltransferase